tara:strand:+ start:1264 stop:1938 length:675 start_codon:yes stop_codon:yes gene_type:complete
MMGVFLACERGFHVLLACGGGMDAPKGLILFSKTPVSINENSSKRTQSLVISILFAISLVASYWVVGILIITTILLFTNLILLLKLKETNSIPVAVNLNHPFMDTDPVSRSEVMVRFTDKWIDPGISRLKLAKDPISGWLLHKQDSDMSILSKWDTKSGEKLLSKQLAIINQAISLNNAVNESKDEFEDARDRESLDSDLLEREWLPEDEFEVQGPISRLFSSE